MEYNGEDIRKAQMEQRQRILKSFGETDLFSGVGDSNELMRSMEKAEENDIEKAKHQDGDMHPNGRWVWRQSANGGKGDWRVANPKRGGGAKKTAVAPTSSTAASQKKEDTPAAKKKTEEKSSYAAKEADAYDKGDGKVGNYPVPTHTSYPAANLYSRLKNNRHFGFKYGLPEEEIMKKLKDYKGNVKVSYHNNAGTIEIYRIKFL